MNRRGTQSSKWDALPDDQELPYIPLSVADMDLMCAPAVVEAVVERAREAVYGYTDLPPDHNDVVCGWLKRRHGWSVAPDHVVPAQRIVQVVAHALRAFTAPGDGVLLFTPSYGPLERAIGLNDRRAERVPLLLDDGRYRLDRVATAAVLENVKAALMVNPHNPVGMVWSSDDLEWLAAQFVARGTLVLSDDVHADFTRSGHRHRFIAELPGGVSEQTITFTSPAKSFNIPGLETTHVIITNAVLRQRLRRELWAAGFHNPSFFSDAATRAAYLHADGWLNQVLVITETNLGVLGSTLEMLGGYRLIYPEGTMLAWVDARPRSEKELRRQWSEGVHVVPSYGTDFGPEYNGFLRINLATPTTQFGDAMDRLLAAHSPVTPTNPRPKGHTA